MEEREQVIYDIERCICHVPDACKDCSKYGGDNAIRCMEELLTDALSLLKAQEPKPVELHTNAYGTKFYFCPKCKRELFHTRNLNFCERCGQAVKWE